MLVTSYVTTGAEADKVKAEFASEKALVAAGG